MSQEKIVQISSESIQAYFADIVLNAVLEKRIQVTESAQLYIINLLCEFARSDRLYAVDESTGAQERDALALMLARAASAPVPERVQLLKKLGDSSLYISGFFAESLARSLVDVDYYVSMGGNAYGTLSDVLRVRQRSTQRALLYAELADKFRELVTLLALVSEQSTGMLYSNESIMRLYDLWQRTRSTRVADKLRAHGLEPAALVKDPDCEQ